MMFNNHEDSDYESQQLSQLPIKQAKMAGRRRSSLMLDYQLVHQEDRPVDPVDIDEEGLATLSPAGMYEEELTQEQIFEQLQQNIQSISNQAPVSMPRGLVGYDHPALYSAAYATQYYNAFYGQGQPVQPVPMTARAAHAPAASRVSPAAATVTDSLVRFRANQASQSTDRHQKRKESHNAVERRRRDHINEMIQRLTGLVAAAGEESARLSKGEVLQRSAELIECLQRDNEILMTRVLQHEPDFQLPEAPEYSYSEDS